jgi:class 3 adenylate cyclase/tetratricopeptide (TPR) repeat protein
MSAAGTCPGCGRASRPGARFCSACGTSLAPRCPACGAETEVDARFCDACGAGLIGRPAHETVARKVVTIVFADLIGSTSLHERLDPESVNRLMARYHRAVGAPVEAHGGTVVQLLGDGVMCAFGIPRVAEDDAIRAVRAAVAMHRAFREFVAEERAVLGTVGLRIAVNTGEVVVTDEYAAGIGDPLNVAARLQQEAHDGDVLIGEATQRLVRDLVTLEPVGTFALKGRAETVTAYRVVSLDRPAGAAATEFVGRDDELRRIMAAYEATIATPAARLVVILGTPGLGKSRLLAELGRRLASEAIVLMARCDAAGGPTFAPLADALRALLHVDDAAGGDAVRAAVEALVPPDESARIADGIAALLAGTPASPEETFFVIRRLLAAASAARPVILAIDDVQWAEPLLLDLTEHLVEWSTRVPLLVLLAARPELRDARPSLATPGGPAAEVVTLGGLDASAATRLAANVIGADELPAAIAGRVLAASEGNPLFVSELVRMLVHDGALKREGERWTAGVELSSLEMPPTIHALLAARVERLHPEDRTVLERAAVIGRQFSRGAVAHLVPPDLPDLDARLESLRHSELIEPDTAWLFGEPALRFHHNLIRDAAYRRLLKGTRAELHGQFADWLETRAGHAVEHDETIGWHLEQAHQHLRELGPIGERGRALGERAARYLGAAGRRALARDDLPLAASLLGRALERLDDTDPWRAELALDWCEALLAAGDVGPATRAVAAFDRMAGDSARLRSWHACFVGQLAVLTDPQALRATARALAAAADTLGSTGDAAGEAKALVVHATALARLGEIGACEAALDRALAAARRGHDTRRANAVLAGAPQAALWGPGPVSRASARCLDVVRVLRITRGAPAVEAVALRCQAVLEALRGRADASRRMIASSRHMMEELGITHRLLEAEVSAGLIELLEEDAPAAERYLRVAYDGLRAHGLAIDAAQAAALLGRALLALGRDAEAEALSHESEGLAGDDLKAAIAWRGVRAEALARRGEHATAIALARAAVEIAAATDALLDHADARHALAVTLRAAGRGDDADVEDERATELWEAKGATLLAERARRRGGRRDEVLDTDRSAEQLARPDAPATGPQPVRLVNAVCRSQVDFEQRWRERDWDGVVATFAPAPRLEDRRSLTGLGLAGEDFFANLRLLFTTPSSEWHSEPIATRGERLALFRVRFTGEVGHGGEMADEHLAIVEHDASGRRVAFVVFGAGDLDAAYTELDGRFAAGEGAPHAEILAHHRAFRRASAARDRDALLRLLPGDFTLLSHRRLANTGRRMTREEYVASLAVMDDLDVRAEIRVEHMLRLCATAVIGVSTFHGIASGGDFENSTVFVGGHDGRAFHVWELFDLEQLDAARARYAELAAEVPACRIESAATRAADRLREACEARDGDRLAALLPAGFRISDRRKTARPELDRRRWIDAALASSSRRRSELLATRGDRLALTHVHPEHGPAPIGSGGMGWLEIVEVDDAGDPAMLILFDEDDLDAAQAELDARYERGEAAAYGHVAMTRAFRRALAAREWDALATLLAPDLIVQDHRRLGWETLHGPGAYLEALRSLVELAPDVRLRLDHVVSMSDRGVIYAPAWVGTRDGGAFEDPSMVVAEFDALHRIRRFDQYGVDQLDEARARFDAIGSGDAHD